MIDLADAREKLRWAEHHMEILRANIEAFEQRDSHSITVDIDSDAGEYVFRVQNLEVRDPEWRIIIGDCVHNARTALDYVAVRLWAHVTGRDPSDIEDIQFPIVSPKIRPGATDADIQKAWTAARDSFKTPATKFAKEPSFSGYLTTIEQLQPFNRSNPSIWGLESHAGGARTLRYAALPRALDRLSRLDNVDKHRVPHAVIAAVDFTPGTRDESLSVPADFEVISTDGVYAGPLEDGTQIEAIRFKTPLPHEWHPLDVDMKSAFPVHVLIDEPIAMASAPEVLDLCLWGVGAVITIFDPVFTEAKPPLPVTAIEEPRL